MQTKITKIEVPKEAIYPKIPFMTVGEFGTIFLIVKNVDNKYYSVNVSEGYAPKVDEATFDTLSEYFRNYPKERIVESEIIIKM